MAKQTKSNVKKAFVAWTNDNSNPDAVKLTDSDVTKALSNVGIKGVSLYEETDSLRIRLYTSEIIMKRDKCRVVSSDHYMAIVNRLVAYAEYLDQKGSKSIGTRKTKSDVKTVDATKKEDKLSVQVTAKLAARDRLKDSLTIAYYLSRMNTKAVNALGYKTFRSAFDGLSKLLGQKPATIKNMRDEFDPYFDNGRAGWYQREMSPSRKEIFEQFKNTTDDELTTLVNSIVKAYTPVEAPNQHTIVSNHARIKISSDGMKVIKPKKK